MHWPFIPWRNGLALVTDTSLPTDLERRTASLPPRVADRDRERERDLERDLERDRDRDLPLARGIGKSCWNCIFMLKFFGSYLIIVKV
jgi:hypothetical protein